MFSKEISQVNLILFVTGFLTITGNFTFFEKTIPVRGGNQWRPFVHVHDAAKSVFLALKTPLKITSGQIFNVGSNDNNFTIKEIGSLINDSTIGSRMTVDDVSSSWFGPENHRMKSG